MNNYSAYNRTIILCTHCRKKLRVPTDKGKISVKCPMCKNNFFYNPNSIFHTLKQVLLLLISFILKAPSIIKNLPYYFKKFKLWFTRSRKNRIIVAAIAVIIVLYIILSFTSKNKNKIPQEYTPDSSEPRYVYSCIENTLDISA